MRIVSLIFVTTLCTTVAAYSRDPSTRPDGNVVASMHDFTEALKRARPGDTVQTPFTGLATIPTLPLTISPVADAPQLLLADQPEYFRTGDGISMQETVKPGLVRLYLYHVPEPTGKPKIISAVVENLGGAPMTIQFHRYASPRPSGDYHKVATAAMQAFLQKQPAPDEIRLRQVAPNERLVIDPAIDQTAVKTDVLVHVFHEFSVDQAARVTVFQRDPGAESISAIDTLPKLPRVLEGFHASGAGRGLFLTSEQTVAMSGEQAIDTADGPRALMIADGKTDPWIRGRDSIDPSTPAENKGNYGVIYRVNLRYRTSDGRRIALLMAGHRPDNKWCRYTAAVISVKNGDSPPELVRMPGFGGRFDSLPQAVVIQTLPAMPPGQTGRVELTYSPPGACCLPTPILMVPY